MRFFSRYFGISSPACSLFAFYQSRYYITNLFIYKFVLSHIQLILVCIEASCVTIYCHKKNCMYPNEERLTRHSIDKKHVLWNMMHNKISIHSMFKQMTSLFSSFHSHTKVE